VTSSWSFILQLSLLAIMSVRALGSSEPRIGREQADVSVLEDRIAHEADNSAASSAEVKNPLNYNSSWRL